MFNALRFLGKPAQYVEYRNEGHDPSQWAPQNAADLMQRVVSFLDVNVRGSAR